MSNLPPIVSVGPDDGDSSFGENFPSSGGTRDVDQNENKKIQMESCSTFIHNSNSKD